MMDFSRTDRHRTLGWLAACAMAWFGIQSGLWRVVAQPMTGQPAMESQLRGLPPRGAAEGIRLDACAVPLPDGRQQIITLDPPATLETLPARLAAVHAAPVVARDGGASPLIVTRDLIARIEGPEPPVLARNPTLVVKSRPGYAPGWIVLRAADPLAALEILPRLRRTPGVLAADVAFARQQFPRQAPDDPLFANQWHLNTSGSASPGTDMNVLPAWEYPAGPGIRGRGVRIGIVDDGLETTHADLSQNVDVASGYDWNGGDSDPSPGQGDRHGTACAGNAAARGNNALGGSGVAPEAKLVGMRLIAMPSTDQTEAEAMVWKNDIIQVKSNSWGPSDNGTTLEGPGPLMAAALANATTNGRGGLGSIIVWAAGNGYTSGDNSNNDGYANSVHTLAVGAIDSGGNAAYYSEAGANVLICAPSDGTAPALGITTTDLTGTAGYNGASSAAGGDYTSSFGGTSAATPMVAGITALMLEKRPQLGWRDVQEILVRTASHIRPADAGWSTNGAGLAFHHRFGAGLVDAAAAVDLAGVWTNLPPLVEASAAGPGQPVFIPENSANGVTVPFSVLGANLRVEHVTVTLDISHTSRGNLEISLTSPAGTVSRLAEVHGDTGNDFPQWTFSTVHCWGETADGAWTLKIADRSSSGNTTGGTLQSATLRLFGSVLVPMNPPPQVAIVSPADGAIFTPGSTVAVEVSAEDLTVDGAPGTVAEVTLFDNDAAIATFNQPPYYFEYQPPPGPHELYARATDDEGAAADSARISIFLVNRPPEISAVRLSAFRQAFADQELRVQWVSAADPDGDPLQFAYQWQFSTDGTAYQDATGETGEVLAPSPARAGALWKCRVTASDGHGASAPFSSAAVNLLARPTLQVAPGAGYFYQSGLVLAGTPVAPAHRAILHEFSQGPSGGNSEWVEIFTLKPLNMGYWDLSDTTNTLVFKSSGIWSAIPAGTLIVIYNGNTVKDPALPPDDPDPSDRTMVVSSTNPTYFDTAFSSWIPLSNSGDSITLNDASSVRVHSLTYGTTPGSGLHLASVGSGTAAHFTGDAESLIDSAASWQTVPAGGTVTPAAPNSAANASFVSSVRSGGQMTPARFSLASGSQLPEGLSLDEVSGVISGTVAEAVAGDFPLRIQRANASGGLVWQSFTLSVGGAGGFDRWIAGFPEIADFSAAGDPDGDGLPNLVEYAAGSSPVMAVDTGGPLATPQALVIEYQLSKAHADVELVAEWSRTLEPGSWLRSRIDLELTGESGDIQEIRALLPIDPAESVRFLRLRAFRVP